MWAAELLGFCCALLAAWWAMSFWLALLLLVLLSAASPSLTWLSASASAWMKRARIIATVKKSVLLQKKRRSTLQMLHSLQRSRVDVAQTTSLLSLMRPVKGRPRIWAIARLLSSNVTPVFTRKKRRKRMQAMLQLRFLIKLRISCVLRRMTS